MNRRLQRAILLLYPRRVRRAHGSEMLALIEDLVTQDGRSALRLSIRLAADGLLQRATSVATVWTVVAVLITTSLGGLAVSNRAAANAQRATSPTNRITPGIDTHEIAQGQKARSHASARRGTHRPAPRRAHRPK